MKLTSRLIVILVILVLIEVEANGNKRPILIAGLGKLLRIGLCSGGSTSSCSSASCSSDEEIDCRQCALECPPEPCDCTPPPPPPDCTVNVECPYKELLFGPTPSTWMDALNFCATRGPGWHLVSILNPTEDDALTAFITPHEVPSVWTSGSNILGPPENFYWMSTDDTLDCLDNWAQGEPNNWSLFGRPVSCIRKYPEYDNNGQWSDDSCESLYNPVCERCSLTPLP